MRDINEQKQVEHNMQIQKGRAEALLEAVPDPVVIVDHEGRIAIVNARTEEVFGYSREELLGQPIEQLIPKRLQATHTAHRTQYQKDPHTRSMGTGLDLIACRKDGSEFAVDVSLSPLATPEGTLIISIIRDVTKEKQAEAQIYNLAFYDALTQLPNRRLFNDRLGQTMASSKRTRRYGALMFLDLDNFKPVNDKHGHAAGDLLLIEVANRLKECVREVDTAARFGGDEFVVMLDELNVDKAESASQARIIAEKIRTDLSDPYLLTIKHEAGADTTIEHCCTVSIGVVVFINDDGSQEDVLKWADAAMYKAKESGGNQIYFSDANT